MANLTLRQVKGEALTHVELDANFTALDSDIKAGSFDSGITVIDGINVEGGIDLVEGNITLRDGDILYNPKLAFYDLVSASERMRLDSTGSLLLGSTQNSQNVNLKVSRIGEQHVLLGNKTSNSGQTTRLELGPSGDGTETGAGVKATQATTNFNDWTLDLFTSSSGGGYVDAITIDQNGETTFNTKVVFADSAEFTNGINITGGQLLVNGNSIASGTVSSVGFTAPTGFTTIGSPVTTSGTIVLGFDAGYSLPTNARQNDWDTAFGWGDHSLAGYLTSSDVGSSIVPSARSISTTNGIQGGGDLSANRTFSLDGTYTGDFDVTGNVRATQDVVAFYTTSDIRLKENVNVIPDALGKVSKLRGVNFNYRESGLKSTGVIAQELQEVLPEAVFETNEEGHLGVRHGLLVGLLIEAIKDLKAEVEELKKR